ncbi:MULTISPECIES: DUF4304 domain-containing protein [Aeromicrobium]|uniref:DUF4304 domain-containing protein n=1 Tax=Aeromicrobium TaxID=2040 RepID=UPI00257FE92D|nr:MULTISPECIES: DUF4304 domain-containing protein [Aeromicrobium]
MTAQAALKAELRTKLGPAARAHGYKGTAPTWRKSSAVGDWAVVNVQSSSFSNAEHLRCIVNLAFAPEPWLRWEAELLGQAMGRSVTESLGMYRQRLHPEGTPEGTEGWWDVTDPQSASRAVNDMLVQLDRAGWSELDRMFSREVLLARVRDGDLGWLTRTPGDVLFARAEALLLMDAGPSDALATQLDCALSNVTPLGRPTAERFDKWVRDEAARARPESPTPG